MSLAEHLQAMLDQLVSDDPKVRADAVDFFYYMARGNLHSLLAAMRTDQSTSSSTLAREYLQTVQLWLKEEMESES